MSQKRTVLLIVDDESSVCRVLRRILRNKVDEIVSAETPGDACVILETIAVTHVLCDQLLGPGQLTGMDLVKDWKNQFPTIQKVIILTGTGLSSEDACPGIDLILPKTTDPADLAMYLGV